MTTKVGSDWSTRLVLFISAKKLYKQPANICALSAIHQPKENSEELQQVPSCQIDTDAAPIQKRGKKYFGYKGQDVESGLIRKRSFTSARSDDHQQKDHLPKKTIKDQRFAVRSNEARIPYN